jgi:hypothetical protein
MEGKSQEEVTPKKEPYSVTWAEASIIDASIAMVLTTQHSSQ